VDFRKVALGLALLSSTSFAAVWERPSGAYTPSNHSANITEFQDDSAAHRAISSAKVDGNLNKAFEGLNDIESRTPPSVTSNAGLFLTNDGASALWAGISTSTIISATGGLYSGGDISATGRTVTADKFTGATVSASLVSASTLRATSVSASNISATNLAVGSISGVPLGFSHIQSFASNGTYSFTPSTTQYVRIRVWGPGGNGGNASGATSTCGGGGGGGGYSEDILSLTALSSNTITVASPGNTSNFISAGRTISATSGANGTGGTNNNTWYAGGNGGVGSGGSVNLSGQNGEGCAVNSSVGTYRGSFGGSAAGGGGFGATSQSGSFNVSYNGATGVGPGGGGAGAFRQNTDATGGSGANGGVEVMY